MKSFSFNFWAGIYFVVSAISDFLILRPELELGALAECWPALVSGIIGASFLWAAWKTREEVSASAIPFNAAAKAVLCFLTTASSMAGIYVYGTILMDRALSQAWESQASYSLWIGFWVAAALYSFFYGLAFVWAWRQGRQNPIDELLIYS